MVACCEVRTFASESWWSLLDVFSFLVFGAWLLYGVIHLLVSSCVCLNKKLNGRKEQLPHKSGKTINRARVNANEYQGIIAASVIVTAIVWCFWFYHLMFVGDLHCQIRLMKSRLVDLEDFARELKDSKLKAEFYKLKKEVKALEPGSLSKEEKTEWIKRFGRMDTSVRNLIRVQRRHKKLIEEDRDVKKRLQELASKVANMSQQAPKAPSNQLTPEMKEEIRRLIATLLSTHRLTDEEVARIVNQVNQAVAGDTNVQAMIQRLMNGGRSFLAKITPSSNNAIRLLMVGLTCIADELASQLRPDAYSSVLRRLLNI